MSTSQTVFRHILNIINLFFHILGTFLLVQINNNIGTMVVFEFWSILINIFFTFFTLFHSYFTIFYGYYLDVFFPCLAPVTSEPYTTYLYINIIHSTHYTRHLTPAAVNISHHTKLYNIIKYIILHVRVYALYLLHNIVGSYNVLVRIIKL